MTALSPPRHLAGLAWLGTRRRSIVAQTSRYLGALAVLATGIAHIDQYFVVAIVAEVAAIAFLLAFLLANQKIRARSR